MELFKIFGTLVVEGVEKSKEELEGVTKSAENTQSKLSGLGGFMSKIGKGVLVATGAVTTGAIGLIKSVSSSYGQLQQSIGGIETLFGDSASKVIENANKAFQTAGISANEYMQQATSFSASLLNALDGDTQKACDSADMAIRDMADNANKMGTSMEMIQNAYQGFSKQNYTMLDNLKLGYGGTKTEMERLLADAEKISGVKYDISNLDDVFNAIHVIQGELGITGTTAQEAGATIEGSFNSLGASWENFIAGLGNPDADMGKLVENLAKGIEGAITNVTPIIENMVQVLPIVMDALINAVSDMAPTLIETFTELVTKVLDAIVKLLPSIIPLFVDLLLDVSQAIIENLPLIVDAFMQLILGLAQGISDAMPTLIPMIIDVVLQIADILLNNIGTLVEVGIQLLMGLAQGLMDALPTLIDRLPQIIETIVTVISANLPKITMAALQIITALAQGLINALPQLVMKIPEIILAMVSGLLKGTSQFFNSGSTLMGGLFNGLFKGLSPILKFFTNLIDKVKGMWNGFTNWIKGAFKLPHFKFSGSMNPADWIKGKMPKIGVEWYKDGGIMTEPTMFGVNPSTGNAMVGGEAGNEAILPIDKLEGYVVNAVSSQITPLNSYFERLLALLGTYLPDIKNNMDRPLMLDTGALVSGTVDKMDIELGNKTNRKVRFGV